MTLDMHPAGAATYTAWPAPAVPGWMLAGAPGQPAWAVIREPGVPAGWIGEGCGCPAAEFLRLAAADHGRLPGRRCAALLIYPEGTGAAGFPGPGAAAAFRRGCLGRHLITRTVLAGDPAVWPGRAAAEPLYLAAADEARQSGYAWRRLHGPVMLCWIGADDASMDLADRQLIGLLARPLTSAGRDRRLAAAGRR